MSEEWNDAPGRSNPQVETQVFTNSGDYGRSNWRDRQDRPQRNRYDDNREYRDYNAPRDREDRRGGDREDRRGGGYRGGFGGGGNYGGNRGPRRQYDDDAPATLIKVPSRFVGRIIGRGGSKINDLQFESGARINVTKDTDGDETVIKLVGDDEAVSKAESLIRDLTVDRE